MDLKASYIARALCHLHLGDSDSALADAEEALELEQTYTKVGLKLNRLLHRLLYRSDSEFIMPMPVS